MDWLLVNQIVWILGAWHLCI